MADIRKFAVNKGVKTHLDGARIFNALAETGDNPADVAKNFDTVSVCLSKGLGAPVGSVLLCNKDVETKARRARKAFGGGMRQAGFLAAAGIYALDHHVKRLKDDHKRAKVLGNTLKNLPWVKSIDPVDTNIVVIEVEDSTKALQVFSDNGIRAVKSVDPMKSAW